MFAVLVLILKLILCFAKIIPSLVYLGVITLFPSENLFHFDESFLLYALAQTGIATAPQKKDEKREGFPLARRKRSQRSSFLKFKQAFATLLASHSPRLMQMIEYDEMSQDLSAALCHHQSITAIGLTNSNKDPSSPAAFSCTIPILCKRRSRYYYS